jgi:D-lactate dehydrogenase
MTPTADIAFYEAFEEEATAIQRYLPRTTRAVFFPRPIQEYPESSSAPAPVVSIRTQSAIPAHWVNHGLKALLSRSTGYDHLTAFRDTHDPSRQLDYGYLPLYCARAVAEHALMLWMMLLRRYIDQARAFQTFHRDGLSGYEASGKQLVVFGVGHIGKEIVAIGKALGMAVYGVDPVQTCKDLHYLNPADALSRADILVVAMSLNAANHNYFSKERLLQLPQGALFINISRGETTNARDLLECLNAGHLGGVGLDVFNHEPALTSFLHQGKLPQEGLLAEIKAVQQLQQHPKAILTPHNAFNTDEAVERKAQQSVEQWNHWAQSRTFRWCIPA